MFLIKKFPVLLIVLSVIFSVSCQLVGESKKDNSSLLAVMAIANDPANPNSPNNPFNPNNPTAPSNPANCGKADMAAQFIPAKLHSYYYGSPTFDLSLAGCRPSSAEMTSGTSTSTSYKYTYAPNGLVETGIQSAGTYTLTWTNSYNSSGNIASLTFPCTNKAAGTSGTYYNYDGLNRLSSVVYITPKDCTSTGTPTSTSTTTSTNYSYTGDSAFPSQYYTSTPPILTYNYTYTLDNQGRVAQCITASSMGTGTSISNMTYTNNFTYDSNGKVAQVIYNQISGTTTYTSTSTYGYDIANRIISGVYSGMGNSSHIYEYNSNGQVTRSTSLTGTATSTNYSFTY